VLHFSDFPDDQLVRLDDEGRVLHDAFVNSIKEADYLRNGTAKAIMTLSKQDSTQLWEAVEKRTFSVHIKSFSLLSISKYGAGKTWLTSPPT
jgi:autophagy-related protein 5